MHPAEPLKLCPHCKSKRVHRSHRRSRLDRLLFFLGAEIRRCQDCRFRHAWFAWCSIPLGEPQATRQRWTSIAVMTSGFAVCLLVLLWVIRRFTELSG
jgi:hypothetical protein